MSPPMVDTASQIALTHCGLVMPYGIRILVNIGSGNGLLSDSTMPLPVSMLTRVLCHSPEGQHSGNAYERNQYDAFENYTLKIKSRG